jgi:MFS family permease
MEEKRRLNYKWVVVGSCFVMIFICLGFCSSVKPLMLAPITQALGVKRSLYAVNDSLRYITTAIVNIFFGTLVARFGARRLVAAGFLCLTCSALCYALAPNVFVFYIGGILLGAGFSWTTTTMVGFVMNKWCKRNKGTIMGAVLAANGLGGATSAQLLTPVIEKSTYGYKNAYFIIALILVVFGTVIVLLLREAPKPGEEEQPPPNAGQKKRRGQSWIGVDPAGVFKKGYTWLTLVCVFLCGMTLNGIAGISSAHLRDLGMSPTFIATVVSCHSIALTCFKFLSGFLYDRFGLRITVGISTVTGVCVMTALALVTNTPRGMVLALFYGVFSSLALPLETIMLPIFAGDLFGERSYNKMLGFVVSFNTAGFAAGTLFMNTCYDLLGTYKSALFVCAMLMLLLTFAFQLVIGMARAQRSTIEKVQNSEF